MRVACFLLAMTTALSAQRQPTAAAPPPPFRNRAGTFQLQLPAGWRQLAPNEARRIAAFSQAPSGLTLAQPLVFYAVGPVDEWLQGDFTSPWLYVVEQDAEWYVADDFAEELKERWRQKGAASGEQHELLAVQRSKVGTQQTEGVVAIHRCTPPAPRLPMQSLDVHVPGRGQQITLCFTCGPDRFAAQEPEFRSWLATLTFARPSRAPATLSDRLWTPLIGGGVVALVLFVLYKHTRSRRG